MVKHCEVCGSRMARFIQDGKEIYKCSDPAKHNLAAALRVGERGKRKKRNERER